MACRVVHCCLTRARAARSVLAHSPHGSRSREDQFRLRRSSSGECCESERTVVSCSHVTMSCKRSAVLSCSLGVGEKDSRTRESPSSFSRTRLVRVLGPRMRLAEPCSAPSTSLIDGEFNYVDAPSRSRPPLAVSCALASASPAFDATRGADVQLLAQVVSLQQVVVLADAAAK